MSTTLPPKPIADLPAYPGTGVAANVKTAVDDGSVTYGASLAQMASGVLDRAPVFNGVGQSAARAAGARLRDTVSIWDYGAVGDGAADDTLAWQRALATGRSVTVGRPGTFRITEQLTIGGAGQRILGSGRHACVFVGYGSFDLFRLEGISDQRRGGGLSNLRIICTNMPTGHALVIYRHSRFTIDDVQIDDPYNGINVARINVGLITNTLVSQVRGEYALRWWGNDENRSDILALTNCNFSGSSSTGARPRLIDWDGNCHTLRVQAVGLITGGIGLHARQSEGSGQPLFLFADGLEIDTSYYEGMLLDAGQVFYARNLYQRLSQTTHGIRIAPGVRRARIDGVIHGNYRCGVHSNGVDVEVVGHIYANSNEQRGLWSGVVFGEASRNCYLGGFSGTAGEATTPRHRFGVEIHPGARRIHVDADLTGNMLAPWADYSGGPRNNITIQTAGSSASLMQGLAFVTERGFGAIAETTVAGGGLASCNVIVPGRGYSGTPEVIVHGDGSGATAVATVVSGAITAVTVTAPGSGYTWAQVQINGELADPTIRPYSAASISLGLNLYGTGNGSVRIGNDITDGLLVNSQTVDVLSPMRLPSYTLGTLPAASSYGRCMVWVSDGAGTQRVAISNGSAWTYIDGTPI